MTTDSKPFQRRGAGIQCCVAALLAVLAASPAVAQLEEPAKAVYRNYDAEALYAQYDNRAMIGLESWPNHNVSYDNGLAGPNAIDGKRKPSCKDGGQCSL